MNRISNFSHQGHFPPHEGRNGHPRDSAAFSSSRRKAWPSSRLGGIFLFTEKGMAILAQRNSHPDQGWKRHPQNSDLPFILNDGSRALPHHTKEAPFSKLRDSFIFTEEGKAIITDERENPTQKKMAILNKIILSHVSYLIAEKEGKNQTTKGM